MSETGSKTTRKSWVGAASLLGAGVIVGVIVTGAVSANAATTPTPGSSSSTLQDEGGSENPTGGGNGPHRGGELKLNGTVTAVGSGSVTIKTSSGAATYTVDADSDIDKNGEATLADLAVGDKVRFSVTGTTIDVLHAGNESADRPGGGCDGGGKGGNSGSGGSSQGQGSDSSPEAATPTPSTPNT